MENSSLKFLISNQKSLRRAMVRIMQNDPISVVSLAKKIGIDYATLKNFLICEEKVSTRSLLKIEKYVIKFKRKNKKAENEDN